MKGTNGTVGVQGPGGGVIVYVDSTNEIPGYDYLEVAPTDGVFASSAAAGVWSTTTTTCGTAAGTSCHTALLSDASTAPGFIGLGTGRAATAAIVTRHNAGGVAKNLCVAGVADAYSTAAGTGADKKVAIAGMRTLNRAAAEQLRVHQDHVHAVTDVTGYGLAGHGWEIAERSGVTLVINASALSLYPGALDIAKSGHRTGGDPRNRQYVGDHLTATADEAHIALCMDPQTSGGLLAAVPQHIADLLIASGSWTAIGHFSAGGPALEIH